MAVIHDLEIADLAYPTDWAIRDRFFREMTELVNQRVHDAFTIPRKLIDPAPASSAIEARAVLSDSPMHIGKELGHNIVWSPYALNPTTIRLFPASIHRSARIRKKLIKRHGGEFLMEPAIWETAAGMIAHPKFRAELLSAIEKTKENIILGALTGFAPWTGPAKGLGE